MSGDDEMLYRSPNLLIDAHEWHVVVWHRGRSVTVQYRFRRHGRFGYPPRRDPWSPIDEWTGPLPKGLRAFFAPFKRSIDMARVSFGPQQKQAWADKRVAA